MASKPAIAALSAVFWLFSSVAHAEPSAAQKEAARSLMAEARDLRDKQDLKAALTRFQAADAIMNVPTTSFEVAKTQADLGLWVDALETVHRILTKPAQADDPEPFRAARSKAADLGDSLRARVASLHLVVMGLDPSVKVAIFVDRNAVTGGASSQRVPVDPGHHRVVAKAAGQEIVGEVDVVEHETAEVELQFATSELNQSGAAGPSAKRAGFPALFYVGGGIAVAGFVGGSVTGLLAISKKHSAQADCVAGACPPSTWSDIDHAHALATASTVSFVTGAVGLAVAAGSLLFGEASTPAKSGSIAVLPVVSARGGALSVSRTF